MSIPLQIQKEVTSIEAVRSTIENDQQVYRWFTFLITHPAVKSQLINNGDAKELYNIWEKINRKQKFFGVLFLSFLFSVAFFKQYIYSAGGILFLYPCIRWHLTKKKCIMQLGTLLLASDFKPADLSGKTLYQIGEFYSRKYKIPSLVDAIYVIDKVLRNTIIITWAAACLVYPLGLRQFFFFIAASYTIVYAAMNSRMVYKHL